MSGPPIHKAVARAIYESHKFRKSWDHPDTVRMWHPACEAEAKAAIAAYHKAIRLAGGDRK